MHRLRRSLGPAANAAATLYGRSQVNLGHHALFNQELIALVIRIHHAVHQMLLNHLLSHAPGFPGKPDLRPLVHHDLHQDFGAQNVRRGEFDRALQVLYAQAQVVELPGHLVQQRQCQPGRQDLVLDHFVTDQLEIQVFLFRLLRRRRRRGHRRLAPGGDGSLQPLGTELLERQPGIPAVLHLPRIATGVDQRHQPGLHRRCHFLDGVTSLPDETLPHLTCKRESGCSELVDSHFLNQTVAPALGSLGSSSFLTLIFTRSSRLMPSHMAMAAATNTEE